MSFIRQRKHFVKLIQDLDAFPKVEEDHQEKTASGGGLSLLVFGLIFLLVVFEVKHFINEGVQYQYDIDPHFDKKLKLNIDLMVAMKCSDVGADILDITGENADKFGVLHEEDVSFDFTPEEQMSFEAWQAVNGRVKENYHRLHGNLWSHMNMAKSHRQPFTRSSKTGKLNGCRFHGNLEVNKVAGNFHVTAGKSISFGNSHMHISFEDQGTAMNFSHRIMHLSFGDTPVVNPLDAEVKISTQPDQMWQYFLQVVPTTTTSLLHSSTDTYQYAVTQQNRTISHQKGSHGLSGIYFKYDLSPIRVKVEGGSSSVLQLVVRLCGIVGGVFATSSFLHMSVSGLVYVACCGWTQYSSTTTTTTSQPLKQENTGLLSSANQPTQNPLLSIPSDHPNPSPLHLTTTSSSTDQALI